MCHWPLSYVCEDERREEDVVAGVALGDGVVDTEAADGVEEGELELGDGFVETEAAEGVEEDELELGNAVVVIVTWDALTSMMEYPVVVTVAAGGVTVTRTV